SASRALLPVRRGDPVRGPTTPRSPDAVRLAHRGGDVSDAAPGAALPLLPRVDALVPEGATRQALGGRDDVRPLRFAQLYAPLGHRTGRRGRPSTGAAREVSMSALASRSARRLPERQPAARGISARTSSTSARAFSVRSMS